MKKINLSHGAGGEEMNELIKQIKEKIEIKSLWELGKDSANIKLDSKKDEQLFFTSDSYTVNPLFFNGGDIGKIAFCGTVNDLCVSGANPLGISLSFVIEEGFEHLDKILKSIRKESEKHNIPIVTGDTKVVEKGTLQGIIINTSGVGIGQKINETLIETDSVIVSRSIGNHGVSLLSARYGFETDIETDSKQLVQEIKDIKNFIKQAKDVTRGGIASTLNEIAQSQNVEITLIEAKIPIEPKVKKMCEILGVNVYELANEGTMIVFCKFENEKEVIKLLKKHNKTASVIGKITQQKTNPKIIIKTKLGKKTLRIPTGNIVPRIC